MSQHVLTKMDEGEKAYLNFMVALCAVLVLLRVVKSFGILCNVLFSYAAVNL